MQRRRYSLVLLLLAIAAITASVSWGPLYSYSIRVRSQTALNRRDHELALRLLNAAVEADPQDGEALFLLARTHRKRGHLNEVRQTLKRAALAGIHEERIRREEYMAMAQVGQLAESAPHLLDDLAKSAEDGQEICEALASGYFLSFRFREAFQVLDSWEKDYPSDPRPHLMRGIFAERNHRWKESVEHFRRAFELEPLQADTRCRLAAALLKLSQTDEAASFMEPLRKKSSSDLQTLLVFGQIENDRGHPQEAAKYYKRVLNLSPDNFEAHLRLGELALTEGDIKAALVWLEKAVAIDSRDIGARLSFAQALQRADRGPEAKSHLDFVTNHGEITRQLVALQNRISEVPHDLNARYKIAELLAGQGRTSEQGAWLRSITELAPNEANAHQLLIDLYESTNDYDLATKHRIQLSRLGIQTE